MSSSPRSPAPSSPLSNPDDVAPGIVNPMTDYATMLENYIPDDATCISVKVNVPDYDSSDVNFVPPGFSSTLAYLKDSGVEILAFTCGLHLEGENKVPHLHYHFVCNHYTGDSNPSQHRKRWLRKKGNHLEDFSDASFMYRPIEPNKPKFQFLSYPMKEGHLLRSKYYMFDGKLMTNDLRNFLLSIGKTIYDTQVALRMRQAKTQQRKQLAYSELVQLVGDRNFASFMELCDWFDENYLYKLDYDDIPDPKNYKNNIRRIGIKKRLIRTFDI